MAEGGLPDPDTVSENLQEQQTELEVLQSIFEVDDDRLEILSLQKLTQDGDGEMGETNNMLKLYIPIRCFEGILHVDVCQMVAMETDNPSQGLSSADRRLTLARSESGQRGVWSFETRYLPPICLHVILPLSYPSHDAPSFVMACDWLSPNQMTILCRQLDQLWQDNKPEDMPGMQILYIWINWLEENVLSFLGLESNLSVMSHSLDEETDDCRVLTGTENLEEVITRMIRYSRKMERQEFYRGQHECSVCFDELPGHQFYLLADCEHHTCKACMKGHCEQILAEGNVQNLMCPLYECKHTIPQSVLRDVLSPEAFARYEDLTLTKGLNTMVDVTWCPRCSSVVIQEPEEGLNLGRCPNCFFSFCTECQEMWHQGEPCKSMVEEEQETEEQKKQIADEASIAQQRQLQLQQNIASVKYIKTMTKRCPSCSARVMKITGCNKVVCGSCHKAMCWQCLKVIESYEHFASSPQCTTFSYQDNDMVDNTDLGNAPVPMVPVPPLKPPTMTQMIERRLLEESGLQERVLRCRTCKCKNLKENRCNLIRCWNCKTSLCFCCQEKIVGPVGRHFMAPNKCTQHS